MYETYPSKQQHRKYGGSSMPSGPGGTSYPGMPLPTTKNDAMNNMVMQSGNGAGKAGKTNPKGKCHCDMFPELNGLP